MWIVVVAVVGVVVVVVVVSVNLDWYTTLQSFKLDHQFSASFFGEVVEFEGLFNHLSLITSFQTKKMGEKTRAKETN